MFEMIYKEIFLGQTAESKQADERLSKKIEIFLQNKTLENLKSEDVKELIFIAGSIGHEEGFLCAVKFLNNFFSELIMAN